MIRKNDEHGKPMWIQAEWFCSACWDWVCVIFDWAAARGSNMNKGDPSSPMDLPNVVKKELMN
jgi:hypothetical protein